MDIFRLGRARHAEADVSYWKNQARPHPHQQTNPLLKEESPEHCAVRDAGWEIAYDGMEFNL